MLVWTRNRGSRSPLAGGTDNCRYPATSAETLGNHLLLKVTNGSLAVPGQGHCHKAGCGRPSATLRAGPPWSGWRLLRRQDHLPSRLPAHPTRSPLECDSHYTSLGRRGIARGVAIERLISRTALGCQLRSRRSAQRFERDTYHGDALPTELRGHVLNCLTWVLHLSAVNSDHAQRSSDSMPETKLPAPGVGELTALLPPWRLHLEAPNLSPRTIRAYPDDGALPARVPGCQGYANSRPEHPPSRDGHPPRVASTVLPVARHVRWSTVPGSVTGVRRGWRAVARPGRR